jgi:hypothetical protein
VKTQTQDLIKGKGSIQITSSQLNPNVKFNPVDLMKRQLSLSLKQQYTEELKRIDDQIKCETPVDPEYILWKNIGATKMKKYLRKSISMCLLIFIIGGSLIIIMNLRSKKKELQKLYEKGVC